MLSRTGGWAVIRKAIFILLLPLSGVAHAASSTISPVDGSTVAVRGTVYVNLVSTFSKTNPGYVQFASTPAVSIQQDGPLNVTYVPPANNIPVQLLFSQTGLTQGNQVAWTDAIAYKVPEGYNFSGALFDAVGSNNSLLVRAVIKTQLAVFNSSTSAGHFSTGTVLSLPYFATQIWADVSSGTFSVNPDILTITYTNQAGVAGKTTTVTIPKNATVGSDIAVPLATGDYGVLAITGVTHTVTEQGQTTLNGTSELVYMSCPSGGVPVLVSLPLNTIAVLTGQTIYMQYNLTGGAQTLRESLIGILTPH